MARLGVKASRDRASVRGWSGKRTSKASVRKAETRGPVVRSRPIYEDSLCHDVQRRAYGTCFY